MHLRHLRYLTLVFSILTAIGAWAYDAAYYAQSSALADGHWVKIAVDTTGVYEISTEQLREWGFEKPELVKVYGYGGLMADYQRFDSNIPDDIPPTPSVRTADDRLVFYAEGTVRATIKNLSTYALDIQRNAYASKAYYYLSDKALSTTNTSVTDIDFTGEACTWHYCIDLVENEVSGFNGGTVFHGKALAQGESDSHTFSIRNLGRDKEQQPKVAYWVETAVNAPTPTTLGLFFSDNVTASNRRYPTHAANTLPAILYTRGEGRAMLTPTSADCEIRAEVSIPSSAMPLYAAVDRSYIVYPRFNILDTDRSELMLTYHSQQNHRLVEIDGADKDIQVWDVSNPGNIRILATAKSTADNRYLAATDGAVRMVAFNPSAPHRHVSYVGTVRNTDLHAEATPDMLIITVESMLQAANELADIHRADGLDVLVASQNDIINEFGCGTSSPAALRRFVKMLYDRGHDKLKYLLLYGRATADPRFINHAPGDYLLTHECAIAAVCRDSGANYASDMYYGMLGDDYNPEQIGEMPTMISVGRLAPADMLQAREVNDKIRRYIQSPPSPASMLRFVRCSDNDNNGIHLLHAKEMTDTMLTVNDRINVVRADILYYPVSGGTCNAVRDLLSNSFSRGAGFFHYNGHSSENALAGERIYSISDARTSKYRDPVLMMFSSCSTNVFDSNKNNLAEAASLSAEGGAIGCIASCRSVYMNYNRILSESVGLAYAGAKAGCTGADILRNARNKLIDEGRMKGDCGYNTLCFNYTGDPAVPLPFARYGIVVDSPAQTAITSHSKLNIKARIIDDGGRTVDTFDGDALIEVFDGTITRKPTVKIDYTISEVFDDNLMAEYHAVVRGGINDTDIVLPDAYFCDTGYRIVISASDPKRKEYAAGISKGPAIKAPVSDDMTIDRTPPQIIDFYIEPEAYSSPETVAPNITVRASIAPSPSGIAMGNTGVRNKLNIILDGRTSYPALQNSISYDSTGIAHIQLELTNLAFGPHTLQLIVPNNAGEVSIDYLNFNVCNQALTGELILDSDGPVRDKAVFDIDTSSQARRLIITRADGETVASVCAPSFPYTWNLKDLNGKTVDDGLYRAWVILESDLARGSTPAVDVTVIK